MARRAGLGSSISAFVSAVFAFSAGVLCLRDDTAPAAQWNFSAFIVALACVHVCTAPFQRTILGHGFTLVADILYLALAGSDVDRCRGVSFVLPPHNDGGRCSFAVFCTIWFTFAVVGDSTAVCAG